MNQYLTEDEFHELQQRISNGEAALSIPPGVAKQFFARVSASAIKGTTGVAVLAEKLLIWIGIILAPLVLLFCLGYVAIEFKWLAALAIPLTGVFWTTFAGYTNENGKWQPLTIILLISALNLLIMEHAYSVAIFLFTLSLWIHRITYVVAQTMLNRIVVNSYAAYDQLADHVEITLIQATADDGMPLTSGPENAE